MKSESLSLHSESLSNLLFSIFVCFQEKSGFQNYFKILFYFAHSQDLFSCLELVIHDPQTQKPLSAGWQFSDAEKGIMLPVTREAGLNDVGMVAWLVKLSTPECPLGREVVLICNDITHQAGSFGTKEDIVFYKASEYARVRGIPR